MATIRLVLPTPHTAQKQILRESRRFNIVDCGRRFGKSKLGDIVAAIPAIKGEPVGWFAPSYKILIPAWEELKYYLKPVTVDKSEQQHSLRTNTGGIVEMWSLENPDAGRSRKYKRAIIDEAAMIAVLEKAWQQAIRPTLTDFRGDAWFMSTPKGRNYFWQLFQRGQDQTETDWQSWKMPTGANPFIPPEEIEAARRELPERVFAQEYLAEFLEDQGSVFRNVLAAAIAPSDAVYNPAHTYIAGADWARSLDYNVFTVMDATTGQMVALDRSNQVAYHTQRARLKVLCDRWHVSAVIAEENSMGAPIIEELQRDGIPVQPFTTTNATKAAIIDALALAFEQGSIQILNDPVLIAELQAFEQTRLPSGLLRYAAPDNGHDDCVMSLALCWYGCSRGAPLVAFG